MNKLWYGQLRLRIDNKEYILQIDHAFNSPNPGQKRVLLKEITEDIPHKETCVFAGTPEEVLGGLGYYLQYLTAANKRKKA